MHKIEFCVIFGHTRRTSRTSAHNPFVRVFVCLCAMPEISEATLARLPYRFTDTPRVPYHLADIRPDYLTIGADTRAMEDAIL